MTPPFDKDSDTYKPVDFLIMCTGCKKPPQEISEYSQAMTGSNLPPVLYVKREEGTYNPTNGHFLCTDCYVKAGMPSAPGGWKAP